MMVCAGTVVLAAFTFVTLGSATVNVAASGGAIMVDSLSSSKSSEALSHFTQKYSTRVNHKEVTDGARFSYQSSAIEPDRQCKYRYSHFFGSKRLGNVARDSSSDVRKSNGFLLCW